MTDRVDRLVASKEGMDLEQFAFDGDDLDDLHARAADASRPDCLRAIEILAPVIAADAIDAATPLVRGGDPRLAAAALAALAPAGEEAVPFLLEGAVSSDPAVALAAWLALQQAAHSSALDSLATAAQQTVAEAQQQATFAQAIVAYRAGLPGFEIPDPDPGLLLELDRGGDVRTIEASTVSDSDFALLSGRSSSERYLLTEQASATTTLTCAGRDLLLAVDAEVRDQAPDVLLQAPAMLALVGLLDPFRNTCGVALLVLTRPDGAGGVRVTVHDPGGEIAYAGGGTVADGAVSIAVQAVARPGAVAVALSGTLTTAGLELTEALSAAQVADAAPKLEAEVDGDEPPIR